MRTRRPALGLAGPITWLVLGFLLICAGCRPASPTATPTLWETPASEPTFAPLPAAWLSEQTLAMRPGYAEELADLVHATCYDLRADISPAQRTVQASLHITYTNAGASSLSELPLRLYANLPYRQGRLDILRAERDGRPITFEYAVERTAVWLTLAPALAPGQTAHIALTYRLVVPESAPDGYQELVARDGIMSLAGMVPLVPARRDGAWDLDLPEPYGDALFAETALFRMQLTLPDNMVLSGTGTRVEERRHAGTRTETYVSGPARDIMVALSPYFQAESRSVGDITVRSYFLPEDRTAGVEALRLAADGLRQFQEWFGAYPYRELELVETPLLAAGMEYPGIISLGRHMYQGDQSRRLPWVVLHEIAHQWWFGLVGNDQLREPWLDEALANYSAWLYFERTAGQQEAAALFQEIFEEPARRLLEEGRDLPINLPVAAYPRDAYGPVVYDKGALFLHALRQEMGDEAFFAFLRGYAERFRYRIATAGDFLALAQTYTPHPLDPFFVEWGFVK
ncbi:MAG: M1 family metallopeptidase [Anaerolineae bacterium]|nr:M1 family metallopeptidase [Anaerolineae bacterium]